jgi:hypothetical protein
LRREQSIEFRQLIATVSLVIGHWLAYGVCRRNWISDPQLKPTVADATHTTPCFGREWSMFGVWCGEKARRTLFMHLAAWTSERNHSEVDCLICHAGAGAIARAKPQRQ